MSPVEATSRGRTVGSHVDYHQSPRTRKVEMVTLKVNCEACGDVLLQPRSIALTTDGEGELDGYAFTCPLCRRHSLRQAGHRVIRVLQAAGIARTESSGSAPSPIDEAEIRSFCATLESAGPEIWWELGATR